MPAIDKDEMQMRRQFFYQLLRQHITNVISGSVVTLIGVALTLASIFCLKPLSMDHSFCWVHTRADLSAQFKAENTELLPVVHFLFYLRYPGPFLAGAGLFFNIMLILYILWLTDFKIKQCYKRKPKFDIYEKAIQKWKSQQQKEANKFLKYQEKAVNTEHVIEQSIPECTNKIEPKITTTRKLLVDQIDCTSCC